MKPGRRRFLTPLAVALAITLALAREGVVMAPLMAAFPRLRVQETPFEAWPDVALAVRMGRWALPWLLEGMESKDALTRSKGMVALGLIGDATAIAPLRGALDREPPNVGRYAAVALARLGDDAGRPLLYSMLADGEPGERWRAAGALVALGDEAPVLQLINELDAPSSPFVHETPREILTRRAGRDLGPDQAAWAAWWQARH